MPVSAAAQVIDSHAQMIAGRYRLISILGEGGMGVTYRAWDTRRRLPAVVKMPRLGALADGDAMRRFAREIDVMLRLAHDHIVPITDHGEENDCPYVVMRFLPGGSLGDLRHRDGSGDQRLHRPGMLHFWLPTVASALDFIHSHGVLHRDVKPGNIFFDGFWNAFLGDFGIAKVVDGSGAIAKDQTLTATQFAIGTPEYMAPELFLPNATPDGRSDQYALAISVYEILAGRKPFTGSRAHIIVEQSTLPVPPLNARFLDLPDSLATAVQRALSKRPADRFTTCGQFVATALRDVLPTPRQPDVTRLLCPHCSRILLLPTTTGGKEGKCPYCAETLRIASDLSALWLSGEEEANLRAATPSAPLMSMAVPTSVARHETDSFPDAKRPSETWRRLALPFALVLAGVLLVMISSLVTHLLWKRLAEARIASLADEHEEQLRAAQDEWHEKLESARENMANLRRSVATSEALVKPLQDELDRMRATIVQRDDVLQRQGSPPAQPAQPGGTAHSQPSAGVGFAVDGADVSESPQQRFTDSVLSDVPEQLSLPYEALTLDQVKKYVKPHVAKHGAVRLDTLTSLSVEVARELAKPNAALSLGGLSALRPDVAGALSQHEGALYLNGIKTLTHETAMTLKNHKGPVFLRGLAEVLSYEVAQALTNWKHPPRLAGLKKISEQAARGFAEQQGALRLDRLTALDPGTAVQLAKHSGLLQLDGLESLSAESALALKNHNGQVTMNGLASISSYAVAKALTNWRTPPSLLGMRELSTDAARGFVEQQGLLQLDGVKTLTPGAAAWLSQHRGILALNGLTVLSPETAQVLAPHQGTVQFGSLTTLSPELAAALGEHIGPLYLDGLKTLAPDAAAGFRATPGPALLSLGVVALSPDEARFLVEGNGFRRHLHLHGLRSVDEDVAEILALTQGTLSLDGVSSLTLDAANAFEKHGGALALTGIRMLGDEPAKALARHRGHLIVPNVVDMPERIIRILASCPGEVEIGKVSGMSTQTIQELAKRKLPVYIHCSTEQVRFQAMQTVSRFTNAGSQVIRFR